MKHSSMVLVDSCIWIEALRKDGDIAIKAGVRGLLDEYLALLCGPVELEVLGGARKNERGTIQGYFDILPYRATDHKIWRKAARTGWELRDKGLTAPWNDVVIATIAREYGYRIYSTDKHFQKISDMLNIRLYTPGYGGSYSDD